MNEITIQDSILCPQKRQNIWFGNRWQSAWHVSLACVLWPTGLKLYYDLSKSPGNRVVKMLVRCASCPIPKYQALDLKAVYKVVLPSYLARGGAGLTVIREKRISHETSGRVDSTLLADYLKAHSPFATGIEGRAVFLEEEDKNGKGCVSVGFRATLHHTMCLSLVVFLFLIWKSSHLGDSSANILGMSRIPVGCLAWKVAGW